MQNVQINIAIRSQRKGAPENLARVYSVEEERHAPIEI